MVVALPAMSEEEYIFVVVELVVVEFPVMVRSAFMVELALEMNPLLKYQVLLSVPVVEAV